MYKALLLLFLLLSNNINAQENSEKNECFTAIVNIQELANRSTAYQELMKKLEKHHKSLQDKSRTIDEELRLKTDQLEKQRTNLSDEEYDEQERQLQKEFEEYAQNYQIEREQFQQEFRKEAELYDKSLAKIIKAVAEEKKCTYILQSQSLLYYNSIMDITGVILSELNNILPNLGD